MSKTKFKQYNQGQGMLPFTFDHMIPANHVVRIVNQLIDKYDTSSIEDTYSSLGAHSYYPKMMVKIIIYAYVDKIFTSRGMAKALRENINFMWLAAGNTPDFRTINRFRNQKMAGIIEPLFYEIIKVLIDMGYVSYENYFLDGTKIESAANKNKAVWKKRVKYSENQLLQKVRELLKAAQKETDLENQKYGDHDLEELGEDVDPSSLEDIDAVAETIAETVKKHPSNKTLKKIQKQMNKEILPRKKKIEEQKEILADRNSYSKTDPDATQFHMKDDQLNKGQPKPGYNVQIGTNNQFILFYSIHQDANDLNTLIPHMEEFKKLHGVYPEMVVADAGYGNLENYRYLEENGIKGCVKYPWFQREQMKSFEKRTYDSQNWKYIESEDKFICPQGHDVTALEDIEEKTKNGFTNHIRVYRASGCSTCPVRKECCKGKNNRRLYVNWAWEKEKSRARGILLSDEGKRLRGRRCAEVENVFGQTKGNVGFKRFYLRGLENVSLEWGLVCLGHNIRHLNSLENAKNNRVQGK